jgi:hypothetical protein
MNKKCWQCNEELDISIEIRKAYTRGYDEGFTQAVNDIKLAGGIEKN